MWQLFEGYVCQKVDWRHWKCQGSVKQNLDLFKWSLKSSIKFARQFVDSRSSKIMEPWFLFLYARHTHTHTFSLSLSLSLLIAYKFVRGGNFIEGFHNFEATMEGGKNVVCWDCIKNLGYNGFVYSNSLFFYVVNLLRNWVLLEWFSLWRVFHRLSISSPYLCFTDLITFRLLCYICD